MFFSALETHPARKEHRRTAAFLLLCLAAAPAAGSVLPPPDPAFDSDRIAGTFDPPRRWLSHPGGRLCLNPSTAKDFRIEAATADLPLDLGAYAGERIIRLPKVLTVTLVPAGSTEAPAIGTPVETWHPYQIRFSSDGAAGTGITGFDFLPSADPSLIRVLQARGPVGTRLVLSGTASASLTGGAAARTLLVSREDCHYALQVRKLSGPDLRTSEAESSTRAGPGGWRIELPLQPEGAAYAVGFGFSTLEEGSGAATHRAGKVLEAPVSRSLARAKETMDVFLRKVPQPATFGFATAKGSVDAQAHRAAYYAAWAFLFQSTLNPLPEHPRYPYPQMSLGKGALWAEGHPLCPATCGWESFLGIQWLSWIDPDFAWHAYEGIMSLVDEEGRLGGESLPSRKADTAWILHQAKPDRQRLAAVYPSIRRYLLWREKNPRWIYGDNIAADEKDIEFAASWMVDAGQAARIAVELGIPADAAMWRTKMGVMIDHMRTWFFRDPEKIHQFWFTESGVHTTPRRNEYRPVMILSALATPGLPDDMRDRLGRLMEEFFDPRLPNAGFVYTKYPDNQFVARGLIDHRMPQALPFTAAILRDSILAGEFAETIEVDKDGRARPGGVKPSLFTALNLIEFTWLLNRIRWDDGSPRPFEFPATPP